MSRHPASAARNRTGRPGPTQAGALNTASLFATAGCSRPAIFRNITDAAAAMTNRADELSGCRRAISVDLAITNAGNTTQSASHGSVAEYVPHPDQSRA